MYFFIIIIIKTESVIPRVKERKGCGETGIYYYSEVNLKACDNNSSCIREVVNISHKCGVLFLPHFDHVKWLTVVV